MTTPPTQPPAQGTAHKNITREANKCARAIVKLVEGTPGHVLTMSECAQIVQCVGVAIENTHATHIARIKVLESALAPFSRLVEAVPATGEDSDVILSGSSLLDEAIGINRFTITVGHVRQACQSAQGYVVRTHHSASCGSHLNR